MEFFVFVVGVACGMLLYVWLATHCSDEAFERRMRELAELHQRAGGS